MDSMEKDIVEITASYLAEADNARRNRMDLNEMNYDCYHLRQDFSHKKAGQSKEFLGKQQMAVEQIASSISQGLVDINDWFSVEQTKGSDFDMISVNDVEAILRSEVDKIGAISFTSDSVKLGLLGSLMIAKVGVKNKTKAYYYTENKLSLKGMKKVLKKEDRKYKCASWDLVRQQDYYPDPTGRGLYELQNIYLDFHEVEALSQGEDAIYDKEVVGMIAKSSSDDQFQKEHRSRETGQNTANEYYRKTVKITEGWGSIVDQDGKVLHSNVTWAVANDQFLISKPKPNPFWHGQSPYVVAPIVRVPHSVWHRALMDAGTRHNTALNEIYNLMVDGGMMATFGIKQLRPDWLEDINQVSKGIHPGMTLEVSTNCPPGAKVLERVDSSSLSSETLNMFNIMNSEFQQSSLTNDLRMGILPARAVKATEVVEASQSITSVFTGVAKAIEQDFIQGILEKTWMVLAQHISELEPNELAAAIGPDKAQKIQALGPEELFAQTANGLSFKVFGVSRTLNKVKDFRKLTGMLQTISGSEILVEEFIKKYDFGKLLEQIMRSLDINMDQIKLSQEEMDLNQAAAGMGGSPMMGGPDMQSQIPQASTGSLNPTVESMIPRADFPASRATPAGQGL